MGGGWGGGRSRRGERVLLGVRREREKEKKEKKKKRGRKKGKRDGGEKPYQINGNGRATEWEKKKKEGWVISVPQPFGHSQEAGKM